jgi:hypothetical protein
LRLVPKEAVMEILVRLGNLLSPSFFAILAGFSLTAAALLFVAGKRDTAELQVMGAKLSELEPPEYKGTAYLVLAFGWSMLGLVLGFVFGAVSAGFFGSLIFVILSLLCLVFTLCFLYAGGGTLLRAVTGQKSRVVRWFFPLMEPIDTLITWFGDLLTAGFFRPSWYPRIAAKIGLGKGVKETLIPVMSGSEKAKLDREMERLHRMLNEYEAQLTPEQREKLTEERRIVEELRSIYP